MAASTIASVLVHRVSAIGDAKTRVAYLRSVVPGFAPGEFAEAREEIVRLASLRDSAAQVTLLALTEALESIRERASAPVAKRTTVLLDGETETRTEEADGDRVANSASGSAGASAKGARANDWGTGRPLTLGERKSLARKPERRILERALKDGHPDVIVELLQNPRLTETDVARMCASRDVRPEVIGRVFASPRWAVRHHVQRAIVNNPRSPVEIAVALVPLLATTDLREVAGDPRLAAPVRALAIEVLQRLSPVVPASDTRH